MANIQPIETKYNGYKFRSRLEARWAVFFDQIDVKYKYEIEGYTLYYHGKYLPDFYLPNHNVWVEIKPEKISQFSKDTAVDIVAKPIELSIALKKTFLVLMGDPLEYSTIIIMAGSGFSLNLGNSFISFQNNRIETSEINQYIEQARFARESRFEFGETPFLKNGNGNKKNKDVVDEITSKLISTLLENFRQADFCPSLIKPASRNFLKDLDRSFELFDRLSIKQIEWLIKYYNMAQKEGEVPKVI